MRKSLKVIFNQCFYLLTHIVQSLFVKLSSIAMPFKDYPPYLVKHSHDNNFNSYLVNFAYMKKDSLMKGFTM